MKEVLVNMKCLGCAGVETVFACLSSELARRGCFQFDRNSSHSRVNISHYCLFFYCSHAIFVAIVAKPCSISPPQMPKLFTKNPPKKTVYLSNQLAWPVGAVQHIWEILTSLCKVLISSSCTAYFSLHVCRCSTDTSDSFSGRTGWFATRKCPKRDLKLRCF